MEAKHMDELATRIAQIARELKLGRCDESELAAAEQFVRMIDGELPWDGIQEDDKAWELEITEIELDEAELQAS